MATYRRLFTFLPILCGLLLLVTGNVSAQKPDTTKTYVLDSVVIVGLTPSHGSGIALDKIAGNVQVASSQDIDELQSIDITNFLALKMTSIHLTEPGGNMLQAEVNYRGFRASPLLGTSQGMAVYQDGVRINESFGDVVNWDLIPTQAIAVMQLMPGSNPQYGLNTLGGSLSLQTKSGFSHQGHQIMGQFGSFGRRQIGVHSGAKFGKIAYFLSAKAFREKGWRDFSKSAANQLFAKLSWLHQGFSWDLSFTTGHNSLRGNGAAPIELLEQDRKAVFTHPDLTNNKLYMLNWQGEYRISQNVNISGNIYYRSTRTETFNGDDSEYEECVNLPGILCEEDGLGAVVVDQHGNEVAADEKVDSATNNLTDTNQGSAGINVQLSVVQKISDNENILIVGSSYDNSAADFSSFSELAQLTNDRGTIGSGIIDSESFTEVIGRRQNVGIYAVDTYSPIEHMSLSFSIRWNYAQIKLEDQLGSDLNGFHTFSHINPSLGFTYQFRPKIGFNISYGVSNRTPTSVELTCADPDDPCRLPNAFLADPPLEQVVARTFEAGWRGKLPIFRWALSAFQTDLNNDIYFLSAGPSRNSGYFDNIGKTRRQGIEVSLQNSLEKFNWYANYTYLDAIFEENFLVNSPNHPNAVNGEIYVQRGDRIPLIPKHIFKAGGDYLFAFGLSLGGSIMFNAGQFLRGDEANLLRTIDGFALVDIRAEYRVCHFLRIFAKCSNLMNSKYETAGLLGEPDALDEFANFEDPRFMTPGSPRGFWFGLVLALGEK